MNKAPSPETAVTLVGASPGSLDSRHIDDIALLVRADDVQWLSEGEAVDLFFTDKSPEDVRAIVVKNVAGMASDVFIQPALYRRKKLLLADMESTIIEQEMLDELADVIGLRDKVADITRRAMNGELDFSSALRERVELLKGQPEKILDDVAKRISLMAGASTLIATMRAHGARCWLVSGGFTCFAEPVATQLGFDGVYANQLVVHDNKVAGEVALPILDKMAKKGFLEKACREFGFKMYETLAVGDGANDIPMLEASNAGQGLGVAYYAKPNVRAVIQHQINYANLTALLYAQGYTKAEQAL